MIFFLHGEDSYSANQKLKQIKEKFQKEVDPSGININVFDGDNFDLEKFNSISSQGGFLVKKRLLIVKDLVLSKPKAETAESLLELLKKFQTSENIFVFLENGSPDKRTSLFKNLNDKKNLVQEFTPLDNLSLKKWLTNYAKEKGAIIKTTAADLLAASVGNNLWQLSQELDKLIAYKNGEEIKETDIKIMVNAKIDDNIFKLTEAIASGDKKLGLRLVKEQFQAGLNENYLLTMIVRQFRILTTLFSLAEQKMPENIMAKETGFHPFVVKKSLGLARKFSLPKLKKIYNGLAGLDKKLKSTTLSPETLIDLLIMEI